MAKADDGAKDQQIYDKIVVVVAVGLVQKDGGSSPNMACAREQEVSNRPLLDNNLGFEQRKH